MERRNFFPIIINMRYLVRINDLKTKNDFLKEKLELIDEAIIKLENNKDKIVWNGIARDSFVNKYNEYITNLKKIEKEIIDIIAYLESYHTNYDEAFENLKNKYIRIYNDVVVNDEFS